ncbi:MAG: LacI family DNA-binding transcriptional regulator [Bacteroidales bacterium]|nr:LacI family DNA-binding transcriptional regulator [Bacteroidales bacterium]
MGKKVRNKDLAEKLGVSCTLVSLVLNNKADQHGIKKETQERVLALARQMGYFDTGEEKKAPQIIEPLPGIIGMIVPSLHEYFVYELTPYLEKAFESIGIGFTVISRDPDDQRFNRFINAFRKFFSGLILVGDAADDKTIRTLKDADFPFVLLEKTTDKYRLNTVATDLSTGVEMITGHINNLGYKNVLVIAGKKSYKSQEKIIKELIDSLNKLTINDKKQSLEIIREPVAGEEIDIQFMEKYLRPPLSIQVLIVMNSELVFPLMAAFEKKKLRIPHDIALISFEDGPGFEFLHPSITALRKPLPGLALKASNMIWSEVKNSGKGKYRRQVNLSPSLIIRKSCGSI